MGSKKVSRDELYEEVWAVPLTHLARKYGISDVGLKKACKKLDVPTPPRGYWVKLEVGKHVDKIELPKLKEGIPEYYEFSEKNKNDKISDPSEYNELIQELRSNKINVPQNNRRYHPLVSDAKIILNNISPDSNGLLWSYDQKIINIKVSKGLLLRTLRILNEIIIQFEKQKFRVIVSRPDKTMVIIDDIEIEFRIRELMKYEYLPSIYRKDQLDRKLVLTGNLQLEICNYSYEGDIRKIYKDTGSQIIEDKINEFLINCLLLAEKTKLYNEKRAEEERIRKIKREELEKQLKKLEDEEAKVKNLFSDIENFNKNLVIRKFIESIDKKMDVETLTAGKKEQHSEWKKWANYIADCMDPTKEVKLTVNEEIQQIKQQLSYRFY